MLESRCVCPTRLKPGRRRSAGGRLRLRSVDLGTLAGVVIALVSTSPQAQTLTQALAEAYNNNPQLLAQRALLRATDEQVPQALSFWRPTVNFTGQVGYSTGSFQTDRPAPPTNRLHLQTRPNLVQSQAAQPIYRGGRTVAQTRQA